MSERRARIVPAERGTEAPRWQPPQVAGPVINRRRDPTAAVRDPNIAAGFDQGFADGHAAGLAAGHAELEVAIAEAQARVTRLDTVLSFLARPLAELDTEVERELVTLALAVAKQLVRRELRTDPAQVIAIIRETVGLLPAAARDVRVHLHPEDAAVVRERLAAPSADRAWTIVEDPILGRGGCRVTTDTASIDARLESRIAAVAGAVFGDERSGGREDGSAAGSATAGTSASAGSPDAES
jgi:flagellar assembly protein FliH